MWEDIKHVEKLISKERLLIYETDAQPLRSCSLLPCSIEKQRTIISDGKHAH